MKSSSRFTTRMLALGLAAGLSVFAPQLVAQQDFSGAVTKQTEAMSAQSGREALMKARQALSKGNVPLAKTWLAEAKGHADAESEFDSPVIIEQMITRHGELANAMRTGGEQYNYDAAMFLLEQADKLIEYNDFATAENLTLKAGQFRAQFQQGDPTPESMLQHLAQVRGSSTVAESNVDLAKDQAAKLLSQAQLAYDQKNFEEAGRLIAQVKALDVPTSAYSGSAILPWELELKIRNARTQATPFSETLNQEIVKASDLPSTGDKNASVEQALYNPQSDATKNSPASHTEDEDSFVVPSSRGKQLFESGLYAMDQDDKERAKDYFRLAWQYEDQLDAETRRALKARLAQLERTTPAPKPQDDAARFESIDGVDMALRQKVQNEVLRERAVAEQMMEGNNPKGALEHMKLLREKVVESNLDEISQRQLTNSIDRTISDIATYINTNITQIETDELNQLNIDEVQSERDRRYDVERKISDLVNQFEELKHEQRYAEALMIAQQANQLAPEMEVVQAMNEKAKIVYRDYENRQITEDKAVTFLDSMADTERAAIAGVSQLDPFNFDKDIERWNELSETRKASFEASKFNSESERAIYYRLHQQQIQYEFNQTPLSEALDILATRAGVSIWTDTRALALQNVLVDSPVTMRLNNPISIHSALNIILGNLKLIYVIEDEVVKVTSADAKQRDTKRKAYYVGDLVVPIPNFQSAMQNTFITPGAPTTNAWGGQPMASGPTRSPLVVDMPQNQNQSISQLDIAMGQQLPSNVFGGGMGGGGGGPQMGQPGQQMIGPSTIGQPGGITEADFDDLMELIQETIFPESWEDAGGTGRMRPFASNLSLVVTATQEVQDDIQDLLTRLRQLNDVQIVIEVRFITLSDNFFERIGIDFDFKLEDNSNLALNTFAPDRVTPSTTVGRSFDQSNQTNTADLDLLFEQGSFASAVPQFGGDLASAAQFGFAILSDIEVYFLIEAAKGDSRTNVVEAPTVTMFNGQSATVNNFSLNPFVTSIIPVVGDFAAAQQPVITLLPEGTQLNVQAVVSPDRRFVRMTMVPFFSQIESVSTFTFEGSRSQRRDTRSDLGNILDALDPTNTIDGGENLEIIEEGTTVQLPVLAVTNVSTTVSVPDGGTVLLGGIKSMSEGRTERGVPMLSNIPYVNRLFKNVGIGRTTTSLMMMVSPRIIITEEEEQSQTGINSFNQN